MFGKKEYCKICGEKLHGTIFTQLTDGKICPMCARICRESGFVSTAVVKQALEENTRRFQQFHESRVVSSALCGFIFIDFEHQWAYISSTKKAKVEPIVFHFSEIEQFSINQVGAKTITKTKTKGGIGRAVVGGAIAGPVGAIVGATTAKTETETKTVGGTPILRLELNLDGIKTSVTLPNPPLESEKIINSMMEA